MLPRPSPAAAATISAKGRIGALAARSTPIAAEAGEGDGRADQLVAARALLSTIAAKKIVNRTCTWSAATPARRGARCPSR